MVASLLLLLAGGACGAPASEEFSRDSASVPERPNGLDVSSIRERTRELGSAVYDVADHLGPPLPTSLAIPGIDVEEAPIRAVGLEPDGEMEIPPASEVGWYELGVAPGQAGSAVMAAHIAYDGVDGVFRQLDRADDGDEVVVGFDDGSTRRYWIVALETYRKDSLPEDIFARTGPERLVLITCGGSFNEQLRSYDSNVVAYAEPIESAR